MIEQEVIPHQTSRSSSLSRWMSGRYERSFLVNRQHEKTKTYSCCWGAASAWPFTARAQQSILPVIKRISRPLRRRSAQFPPRSNRIWLHGRPERSCRISLGRGSEQPVACFGDLVQREVSVIVARATTPGSLAAKAATSTIPIVILTAGDPVALGLVTSLNRPGRA
jgi:putative ABC transport system substrate-binding protein